MSAIELESPRTVCLAYARGCPRSAIDLGHLHSYFVANGWRIKGHIQDAEFVVVSTCGFDTYNEKESMRLLSVAEKKRAPGSTLIVVGCLAGINPSLILDHFDATVISPKDLDRLDDITNTNVKLMDVPDLTYTLPVVSAGRYCFKHSERIVKARRLEKFIEDKKPFVRSIFKTFGIERIAVTALHHIKHGLSPKNRRLLEPVGNVCDIMVARGCLGECAYCAIRFAAGPLKSKPLQTIFTQFDNALAQRFRHFRIIAGDVGPYGQDIGTDVYELFRGFFCRSAKFKLTIRSINPKYLIHYSEELTQLFIENVQKINYLSVPIQSGSERIVELMKRQHSVSQIKQCLVGLKRKRPELTLDTQVLVGFPTETRSDFADTLQLLRDVKFDRIIVYRYSDRPNTPASNMQGKVSEEIIMARISQLQNEFSLTAIVDL